MDDHATERRVRRLPQHNLATRAYRKKRATTVVVRSLLLNACVRASQVFAMQIVNDDLLKGMTTAVTP